MSVHEDYLRRLYAAWNEGGPAAMRRDYWHEDVIWHDPPVLPDAETCYGAEATERHINEVMEAVGRIESEVRGITDTADGAIVDLVTVFVGQQSGANVDAPYFHVLRIEDDRVAEIWNFQFEHEARALAEQRGVLLDV